MFTYLKYFDWNCVQPGVAGGILIFVIPKINPLIRKQRCSVKYLDGLNK